MSASTFGQQSVTVSTNEASGTTLSKGATRADIKAVPYNCYKPINGINVFPNKHYIPYPDAIVAIFLHIINLFNRPDSACGYKTKKVWSRSFIRR